MSRINFALSVLALQLGLISTQAQTPKPDHGTAFVSGVVTLKGKPSCGVGVQMVDQGEPRNHFKYLYAETDENGRFRFYSVAARKYWITARAPGHISPGNDSRGTSGQTLEVAEGEKIENITLEIKRGGVITGRITDSRGAPVADEEVRVHRLDQNGDLFAGVYETRTDDRGVYRFYGLPEGRFLAGIGYEKDAQGSSAKSPPRFFYPNVTSKSEAKVIEVALESNTNDIDITLSDTKNLSIKGEKAGQFPFRGWIPVRIVTEEGVGLPHAKMIIARSDRDGRPVSKSSGDAVCAADENGNCNIPDFGPVDGPDFYRVIVMYAKGYAPKQAVFQCVGGAVTINMVKGAVITGRIRDAKGNPVIGAGISVELTRDAGGKPTLEKLQFSNYTDDRGVYRLCGLRPGSYVVYSYNRSNWACQFAYRNSFEIYYPSSTRENAAEVTVRSGAETSGIDIRYSENRDRIK
jgi:hypothetical protein